MIITKAQFEKDILTLAEYFGQKKVYEYHIEQHSPGLPRLVEMVAYELFIKQFDSRSCSQEIYESYRNVLDYTKELRNKGFVEFK